ncbi:MAG: hypothetical protein LBT56_07650 [Prevotellaceae bacterium]|jgi:hypothetical protein|nr:hypothetical protein [Prevotellaceae bacterium]
MSEQKNKLAEIGKAVLGLVIIVALAYNFLHQRQDRQQDKNQDIIEEQLVITASKYNEKAPFMIDENTRFDNMIALPGRVLQYNFTAINMTKDEIEPNYFENEMKPIMINQIRTNPDETFRKHKVTLRFYYKDKDGVFVSKIEVTPEMYE